PRRRQSPRGLSWRTARSEGTTWERSPARRPQPRDGSRARPSDARLKRRSGERPLADGDDLVPRRLGRGRFIGRPEDEVRLRTKAGSLEQRRNLIGAKDVELDVFLGAVRVLEPVTASSLVQPSVYRGAPGVHHAGLLVGRKPVGMIEVEHQAAAGTEHLREPGERLHVLVV